MFKLLEASNRHFIESLKRYFHLPFSLLHTRTKYVISNPAIDFVLDEIKQRKSSEPVEQRTQFTPEHAEPFERIGSKEPSTVQILHPWPEWVGLMQQLIKRGYLEGLGNMGGKESNRIRTACLNFARERVDLIRCFSRKDIRVLAGSGCPSIDRKVVNSGKRLRARAGIDEGKVCSSCILRGNCERAYLKAHEDEGVNAVDVMRFLITYGLDPDTRSVKNKPRLNKKVLESVRRLLTEFVEFSMKEPSKWSSPAQENSTHHAKGRSNSPMKLGNWICPKCNFINSNGNVKCEHCDGLFQERPAEVGADQDRLPMKKGDWICDKCNFLNYAKNTRCLQCKEKPPKRQLNPGEWECESCNYINFRRNIACMICDHKLPKASYAARMSAQDESDNGP